MVTAWSGTSWATSRRSCRTPSDSTSPTTDTCSPAPSPTRAPHSRGSVSSNRSSNSSRPSSFATPLRGPNITVADVINAIDYALPAIEIIDSRVQNWAIDLPDTLADNGSTGAVILGGTPRRITDLTLRDTARHPALQRARGHRRQHRQHPRQSPRRRRLAVQPPRRLRRRVRSPARSSSPAAACRQCPMNQAGQLGRHLRGLGNHRIRRFLPNEQPPRGAPVAWRSCHVT